MTIRLRTISQTADGRAIVRDRDLAATRITIGRSAENDIHLPDLAVEPRHAAIEQRDERRLTITATGTLGFTVDGKSVQKAEVDCQTGAELRFGGYRIGIALDTDGVPLLTIEPAASDAPGLDAKRVFSLGGVLPGKRRLSWIFVLVILGLFLALPIVSHLTRDSAAKQPVIGDGSWSPGKLSVAHHALESRCEACHVRPFEAVRDETCLSCHKAIHDHAPLSRLADAHAKPGLGGRFLQTVARTFGKPGPGACSDCHNEHLGAGRMEPARQQFCADCHGTLDRRLGDTKIGNAADFGLIHPQFHAAIPTQLGSRKLTRVSLGDHPRSVSGLAFPHKMHLAKLGGVARMAASIGSQRGYGADGLKCADCHHSTEDGVRFLTVNMDRDCGACHSLAYDRVGGIVRRLKHGDVNQMIADLTAASQASHPAIGGRRRPGEFSAGGSYYANFGSAGIAQQALSRDGICGECHTPALSGGRLSVMPVTQVSRFMTKGWFDHRAHRQEKCVSCHAADTSTTSADVLLPGIGQCRTCHLGESSSKAGIVPSSCAMCHTYHPTDQAPTNKVSRRR
jgi:FHA domain/Cytochrome c3